MKAKRKGQGALEYLMTYGWALLIIVVVAAALYALGVLNPATYAQSTCTGFTYFKSSQVQKLTADNGYTIQIMNGDKEINITTIKFGSMTTAATPSTVTVDGVSMLGQYITSGRTIVVTYTTDVTDRNVGDTFSGFPVTITYNIRNGVQDMPDIASCSGKVV